MLASVHHLPRGNSVTIGRGDTCHIQLDDELISREHCRLQITRDIVRVVDLGSRNGTFVNGARVQQPTRLRHGDRIKIAFFDITFQAVASQESTSPTLELIYCHSCRAALSSAMKFCGACGQGVRKEMSCVMCPSCMGQVTPHMHFCPLCGYRVRQ